MVVVKDLCKSFNGQTILNNISFTIREGDMATLIGSSGCGKSTFLRCINCLELMDSGSITVAGVTVERKPGQIPDEALMQRVHELRTEVGMVFQSYNLFPHKSVIENIMLAPIVVKKMSKHDAHDIAIKFLDKVGLLAFAEKYPSTLSGGQQQRAAIARALAMNPKVMLYDEPTSALDPELVGEVLQVMKDLDSEGMTQIIVSHEMKFARDASDYIIFIADGEFVEYEDGDVLFEHPKHEKTKAFLRHLTK